uniref:Uncharacterized protein ycf23 n=1 Tax=Calliarthron tuberculosum TaxID=48942 RepID=M4IV85_CALTB|nr:conserved hypothetical plastid protein [Calliarthron tuberculosum]AGA63922.1 conserved hypothetical plastid protein [Calliarthron tuberculosum]
MILFNKKIHKKFTEKNLKIITGLNNLNVDQIIEISSAADIAGATYLDIAANPLIIREIKKHTLLPICVSSISLKDLYHSAVEGIDAIEIGNYDYFYTNKIALSQQHILGIAKEALKLFPELDICVTIPYNLSIKQQVCLSLELEKLGIQIIQTESKKVKRLQSYSSITELIEKAAPVLSSTYAISKAVSIPVIASSGVESILSSLALLYGASGVGVGQSVKNHENVLMKSIYMREIIISIQKKRIISTSNIVVSDRNYSSLIV